MRALELNLASRPFKNNTLLWLGYGSAVVLLIAFTVGNVLGYRSSHRKLAELNTTIVNIEQENLDLDRREQRSRQGIARFDVEFLELQAARANEIIGWKAFSWTRLFNRMAKIQPHGVKMVSIRPVLRSTREGGVVGAVQQPAESVPVLVEGVARNLSALWEFQKVLLADAHFGRVEPERLNRGDQREILFQLRFEYYPGEEPPPVEQTPVEEAVQTVSEAPPPEAEPAGGPAAEPAAVEPPRRKLPPAVDDGADEESTP